MDGVYPPGEAAVKVLALVPSPTAAYGMGAALAALPAETARIVAFGQATAAVLPEGLDVFVYPIREGTVLPGPFLDALVQHEKPQVLLAPAGAVTNPPLPTLILDLDTRIPAGQVAGSEEPSQQGWIEAVTALPERRQAMIRSGLFSVDLSPEWFAAPGRLSADTGPLLNQRLLDLAGLSAAAPEKDEQPPPEEPLSPFAPPEAQTSRAEEFSLAAPVKTQEIPVTQAPEVPLVEAHTPDRYRDREAGNRLLILAGMHGLDALTPADLSQATIIAVPETLGWLSFRMGVCQFICASGPPRTLEHAAALRAARAVLVHADHLEGETLAPRCRARVPLLDLHRAGGPSLGWSDEMAKGFFPGPGDMALALQWAHWLGAAEIVLAGLDPAEGRPLWPAFFKGARELLTSRGVCLLTGLPGAADTARPAVSTQPVRGRQHS